MTWSAAGLKTANTALGVNRDISNQQLCIRICDVAYSLRGRRRASGHAGCNSQWETSRQRRAPTPLRCLRKGARARHRCRLFTPRLRAPSCADARWNLRPQKAPAHSLPEPPAHASCGAEKNAAGEGTNSRANSKATSMRRGCSGGRPIICIASRYICIPRTFIAPRARLPFGGGRRQASGGARIGSGTQH